MAAAFSGRMGSSKYYSISFVKKISRFLIAVEKEIKLGEFKKRCDIVVYNRKCATVDDH